MKKRNIIYSALAIFLVGLAGEKIYTLAAPPKKEKDCDFTFPNQDTVIDNILPSPSDYGEVLAQKGGYINDASCLNKTSVFGIIEVSSEEDVRKGLIIAEENNLHVTSAGQKHSMGGQAFSKNGLILDMRNFDEVSVDKENMEMTVQSGATWAKVQELLDKEELSVKAMQSINIFTVGGTLSVNAHGIAHDPGQIAPTVKSLRIMKADGTIVTASPTENTELFKHVLGGYGLFGVILDATLEVVPNESYVWSTKYINYKEFPEYYKDNVENNPDLGLMYARLSVSPTSYLTETAIHEFRRDENRQESLPELKTTKHNFFNRFVINFSKTGGFGRWVRWMLEKYVEPYIHNCISRNQAMSQNEVCIVSRNQQMYDSMGYLKNRLKDTDILQEYFIPQDRMVEFVDGLRHIVKEDGANLLNVTIRIVHEDTVTALPYAKDDRFAFVLYFNQKLNEEESEKLKKTTSDLIDLTESLGGTFYLPYQLYYSDEQLKKAYPEIDAFVETKKKYDPSGLFTNKWFEKYGGSREGSI